MRFASLGSGSEGNALLIETREGHSVFRILIDCGFRRKEAEKRLRSAGIEPGSLSGILVTHEHSDHVGGVFRLSAAYSVPVFMTHGTLLGAGGFVDEDRVFGGEAEGLDIRLIEPDRVFNIGAMQITPVAVPHDAREPVQYVINDGRAKLGVLTDIGHGTAHVQRSYSGLDALVIECNHDPGMLAGNTRYPEMLKRRISGPWGHLANDAAREILSGLDQTRLRRIAAAHLSRQNNTSELARAALAAASGSSVDDIAVADQDSGLNWIEI